MPAHLTMITPPRCQHGTCKKTATRRLVDTFNTPKGEYCDQHATAELRVQQGLEADAPTYARSTGRFAL